MESCLWEAFPLKFVKLLIFQRLTDLHDSVCPEIEDDDRIAILDGANRTAILICDHKRRQLLV